jgi:hypothetical protein
LIRYLPCKTVLFKSLRRDCLFFYFSWVGITKCYTIKNFSNSRKATGKNHQGSKDKALLEVARIKRGKKIVVKRCNLISLSNCDSVNSIKE